MFNEALSGIINLLKLKKDAKKTDLEIEKLERERKKDEALLHIASVEEIKTYDPRVREVFDNAERLRRRKRARTTDAARRSASPSSRGLWWIVALIGLLVAYIYITHA